VGSTVILRTRPNALEAFGIVAVVTIYAFGFLRLSHLVHVRHGLGFRGPYWPFLVFVACCIPIFVHVTWPELIVSFVAPLVVSLPLRRYRRVQPAQAGVDRATVESELDPGDLTY
jgi:hypothetical protein